ncbi:MAG: HD domain-containing protein [Clostridia bacterium]|nr:HD domain-containing protein [Clostridia bacterium]
MKITLPEKLKNLANSCPFPLYVVGGYVRDALAGLKSENCDIDICAPVSADEFCSAAKKCGATVNAVYRNTGTVKLSLEGEEYEFASFRSDEYVRGVHNPVKTFFTDDIYLDARRRDFKCNAVYYDIKGESFSDPLGGIDDIQNKRISTVAEAEKVFGEDGLRLMRLARQSAQTGFIPTADCLDGAKRNAKLIADCSAERVYAELNAILHSDEKYGVKYAQYAGFKILDDTRVLDVILPELTLGRGMAQRAEFHYHDVLEHSLRAVKYADGSVRLAALMHDIGKPYCMKTNGNYHGHEVESERISADVLHRLKAPKKLADEVAKLAALHMYDFSLDAREIKVRRFIVRNLSYLEKLLFLKQADFSACRDDLTEAPTVTKWKAIYKKMQDEGAPLDLKGLDVRGNELIEAGVPAAKTGEVLQFLLEECAVNPSYNEKQFLIKRALSLCAVKG